MNKKADERMLSVYLFIVYIIVAIGIVAGVIVFYGSPLDVREAEAGILSNKVIDCIADKGRLDKTLDANFDLEKTCKLDLKDEYAVKIDYEKLSEPLVFGEEDYLKYCNAEGDKIPKCDSRNVYLLDKGEGRVLEITSAVRKIET